jgi:hypothetical protein
VAAIVTQGAAIRVVRPLAVSIPVIFALSADPEKAVRLGGCSWRHRT